MRKRWIVCSCGGLLLACLLAGGVYFLPPVHDRLAWRVNNLRVAVLRYLTPAEKVTFLPKEQPTSDTASLLAPSPLPQPTAAQVQPPDLPPAQPAARTPTPESASSSPAPAEMPTETLTVVAALLPDKVTLKGLHFQAQTFNNCGPANLAMALSYWGWTGDQADTRAYLRPNYPKIDDKNVRPEEMVDFVLTQTNLKALRRVGGDLDLIRRLIAAGFPVLIEKGHQPPKDWWMGHYLVINGYNDNKQRFTAQDSLLGADNQLPYAELGPWWRDFNYVYIVIYPPEREADVLSVLGPQADEQANYQYAAEKASQEIPTLSGRDQYFAWYNLGTNLVALKDYAGAAAAYDQAFAINASLPEKQRLYRMLWYQVGPYEAYFYAGRYQDLLDLGNATLAWVGEPLLEETFYWLGRAREARGDLDKAVYDYNQAVRINPRSTPAQAELDRLRVQGP
jgi:hypothetical protein